MRLFFAIELPPHVQSALAHAQGDSPDYRWVDPGMMHLTLAFLGEQHEARLAELEEIGREAARQSQSGELRLAQAGHFGPARAPHVLWVDLGGQVDNVLDLQRKLTRGLQEKSFPTEQREFRAHITLARRRERASGGAPHGWPPTVQAIRFTLQQLTLMQSRTSPKGATYAPVFHFVIGG